MNPLHDILADLPAELQPPEPGSPPARILAATRELLAGERTGRGVHARRGGGGRRQPGDDPLLLPVQGPPVRRADRPGDPAAPAGRDRRPRRRRDLGRALRPASPAHARRAARRPGADAAAAPGAGDRARPPAPRDPRTSASTACSGPPARCAACAEQARAAGELPDVDPASILLFLLANAYGLVFMAPVAREVTGFDLDDDEHWQQHRRNLEVLLRHGLLADGRTPR